jgi:hypothetical protein
LVHDPKSVRSWPQQQMPAFPPTILPDAGIDALIVYLKQIEPASLMEMRRVSAIYTAAARLKRVIKPLLLRQ